MNIEEKFRDLTTNLSDSPLGKLSGRDINWGVGRLNGAVDALTCETRDFGLDKCSEAAKAIFTPEVIGNWSKYTNAEREAFVQQYAEKAAEAFKLHNFKKVVFERLSPGTNGYNNGDGVVHLSDRLLNKFETPLQLIDTVTHELRHQYQSEAIRGLHNISEQTRQEWKVAEKSYTTKAPWAADPWGYKYNPLEIDSRFAAETVVRNITKDYINGYYA